MTFQAGAVSKWTNDSQRFLLEHFDTIHNSPSHIYHSALPLSPSSSWLQRYYNAELSLMVNVVKGLPVEWGGCSRTILLNSLPQALSCHNNTIAVGCKDGGIIILNAITGSQIGALSGHTNEVICLMFSSNGTLLASGSRDHTVKLWDMQTGGVMKTFYHSGYIESISILSDCTRIASSSYGGKKYLWDVQTEECLYTIQEQDAALQICFSPMDPQYLFFACGQSVWQWDTNGNQVKHLFDGSNVSFSPDGTQFFSYHKGAAIVQNSDSGAIVTRFKPANNRICESCFSPDGRFVAGVDIKGTAYIWDITTSNACLIGTFVGHTKFINSFAFSSFSLITASCDGSVKIWQIGAPSTDLVATDLNPTSITSTPIQSIALQAKDNITITSGSDGIVKVWDISTGLCKNSYQTPAIYTSCIDVQLIDGRLICVWYEAGMINMWDSEKGELWKVKSEYVFNLQSIKISPDRSKIFHMDSYSIRAYSIQTGKPVKRLDFERGTSYDFLIVDGSRVWAYTPNIGYEGWDFGIPGLLFVQSHNIPPHRLHPSGTMLWDTSLLRINNQATGKVVFQLSRRFTGPVDVQWNGKSLVLYYPLNEVLILDFSHLFPV